MFIPLAFAPRHDHHPHPKFFPSPLPEFITSAALWSFAYQLRLPLFSLISTAVNDSDIAVILHASSHVVVYNLLRLAVLPILGIRNDMEYDFPTRSDFVFFRVWWAALGWSFVEVIVAIWQGYEQLALYQDIMIPSSRVKDFLRAAVSPEEQDYDEIQVADLAACRYTPVLSHAPRVDDRLSGSSATDFLLPVRRSHNEDELEQNLDILVRIKSREELEQVYGVPVIVSHSSLTRTRTPLTNNSRRRTSRSSSPVYRGSTRSSFPSEPLSS